MKRGLLQIAVGLLCLAGTAGFSVAADVRLEYEVKAAFLYNFAKFVEWPKVAFGDDSAPLTFCLVGGDPFGPSIDRTVKGRAANGRTIVVRHDVAPAEASSCHLVFLAAEDEADVARVVHETRGEPVLTVGEAPSFLDEGGIIGLVVDEGKVRFEVSASNAERAGLKVSSQLLKLARSVKK